MKLDRAPAAQAEEPALCYGSAVAQADQIRIDAALVRRLLRAQFPGWAGLPVEPVVPGGWDNRTFRLGDRMVVRLPSAAVYEPQVEKEQRWLPVLAPALPLPIPEPIAMGVPGEGYPWHWSVLRWLDGEAAEGAPDADRRGIAVDLAKFINALQRIDPTGGPEPGPQNFYRGGPLQTYDAETRRAIERLAATVDAQAATQVWETALAARDDAARCWLHGDISPGNLLLQEGRLSGVIDFGGCAVGDPACDLAIAWTFFDGADRDIFRDVLGVDANSWARGRGWALWKALITAAGFHGEGAGRKERARATLVEVVADGGGS